MINPIIFGMVTFLHDLFTAVWIGGLIFLALIVLPTAKNMTEKTPATKQFLIDVQKRLRIFVYISMFGLLITGILLSKQHAIAGPSVTNDTYALILNIKHLIIALMIAIGVLRSTFYNMKPGPSEPKHEKISMILLFTNVFFGVGVLLLSGLLSVYA